MMKNYGIAFFHHQPAAEVPVPVPVPGTGTVLGSLVGRGLSGSDDGKNDIHTVYKYRRPP
jgi:hypothetical protein